MKHLGHIEIQGNKIVFVYYKKKKPDQYDVRKYGESTSKYFSDWKEYEASKREVEVENKYSISEILGYAHIQNVGTFLSNNQPCQAEITDKKATITKIIT